MSEFQVRVAIGKRPPQHRDGDVAFVVGKQLVHRVDEAVLAMNLVTRRQLFGRVYSILQGPFFRDQMHPSSGVFVSVLTQTPEILPGRVRPGDIDLLVIPYQGDELVLERTLAVEVKAIRATFAKPGRSPNEFGFSQAAGLLDLGFPYVAVAHLIVSDGSPTTAWKDMTAARILDRQGGLGPFYTVKADVFPGELVDRALGRLVRNSFLEEVGLVGCYISHHDNVAPGDGLHRDYWVPDGKRALFNPRFDIKTVEGVATYFHRHPGRFLDNPWFDPPSPVRRRPRR